MVRNYKRVTKRGTWTKEMLSDALENVKNGQSIRSASIQFGIPFASLHDRVKKGHIKGPKIGRRAVFTPQQESKIADHLKMLANMFYGLSPIDFRRAAFEYAERNNLKHNFNKSSRMAGRDWLEGFLKRNPSISVRKPEATSIPRIRGFNKTEVTLFFTNMQEVMTKYKLSPTEIFNVDESGMGTVQEPGNILAPKGQKRVGSVTSWERGKNITVICCMNGAGRFIPPMIIFPRQRMSPVLQKGGPPGAAYACSKNGWSNEELFMDWLKHFHEHVRPNTEKPVLLILDNHYSHITLDAYDFCKNNGIIMLSIPPHTSHRLQPLDVTFFGPLKKAYNRECDVFMKVNHLKIIRPDDFAALFCKAYSSVATVAKGISGFKSTGICPLDVGIFTDEDFIHTNIMQQDSISEPEHPPIRIVPVSQQVSVVREVSTGQAISESVESESETPTFANVPFETVSPVPGPSHHSTRRNGRKQHSAILTQTPLKELLVSKKLKQIERKRKLEARSLSGKKKSKDMRTQNVTSKKKAAARRKILETSSEEEDSSDENICDDNECDDIDEGGEKCLVCEEFGMDNEEWYRCTSCGLWAHSLCTGWDTPEGYTCDVCLRKT